MNVYVASSWRNTFQPTVVKALRAEGHAVYDFRNPSPEDHGFSWRQVSTHDKLTDPRSFRDEVLTHPVAKEGFRKDMSHLERADATVLVLPCGRSAHLELGYATGSGQRTIVLLDDPLSEPELMYLMNSAICVCLDEVVQRLREA